MVWEGGGCRGKDGGREQSDTIVPQGGNCFRMYMA